VEHHLVSLAFPLRSTIGRLSRESLLFFLESFPYDRSYSDAQALCLLPAAVGQGRVVRGWRREMPLLVGSVEAISVSVKLSETQPLHHGSAMAELAHLTTNRYAGGRPIAAVLQSCMFDLHKCDTRNRRLLYVPAWRASGVVVR
jgi:hypothetical protein